MNAERTGVDSQGREPLGDEYSTTRISAPATQTSGIGFVCIPGLAAEEEGSGLSWPRFERGWLRGVLFLA